MVKQFMQGKNITLGICGGISAYKSALLVREIVKAGGSVKVVMTKNACEFVAPLTFQTLSNNPVFTDTFSLIKEHDIAHISLAQFADVMVIAPATANVIGKIANGIADDLLTSVVMATKAPVIICPAMNENMYNN
ncbi:MAG: flavoprotein, partial [Deltaproteobacteria bacterium]